MKKRLLISGSWLLLLIFSVIQLLPALHHHAETTHITAHSSDNKEPEFKLDKLSSDCSICSFIAHKQVDYPSNFTELTISFHPGKPLVLDLDFSQQFFQSAVHTWTNKGPPTV